jgi:two-component system cell cycle response regulator CpdR
LPFRAAAMCGFKMGRRVLVVDDDADVLEATAEMLNDLGCDVVTALSGEQALEQLERDQGIEILITDINMPKMNGYELADRARAIRKGLKVIMLSGREFAGNGLPFIRKPFFEQDLLATMRNTTGTC